MTIRTLTTALLFLLLHCSSSAQDIPESQRSRLAVERVRPRLVSELQSQNLELGNPVFVRIFKESKELEVWVQQDREFVLFRTYKVCAASGRLGPKIRTGDYQSPEGFYFVTPNRLNPWSSFHLSFNLGYPNAYDRIHGRTGSALMVHGNCVSIGCYAMTDPSIEEIYTLADAAFRGGQPFFRVHVFPFRMSAERMLQAANSRWIDFWNNLQSGYDFFERENNPPNVNVSAGNYTFE